MHVILLLLALLILSGNADAQALKARQGATSDIVLPSYLQVLASFPIDIPRGCHARLKRSNAMERLPLRAYRDSEFLYSYDVLCVGALITVDRPIRTRGGTVFILAKRIVINAPIDTRPYFRARQIDHYGQPDEWPKYTRKDVEVGSMAEKCNASTVAVNAVLNHVPNLKLLYEDYFIRSTEQVVASDEVWLPELPAGVTPPFINYFVAYSRSPRDFPRNGLTPPDDAIDWAEVRSGDIVLVASDIRHRTLEGIVGDAPDPLDCSAKNSFVSPLLDARGARGGRGGLGQPDHCISNPLGRGKLTMSCIREASGLNAAGGRGAPAGSIFIHRFGQAEGATDGELLSVSRVTGGPPGSRAKFRVPTNGKISAVCAIPPSGERWPAPMSGEPGVVALDRIGEGEAWQLAFDTAKTLDSIFAYDALELASRAEKDSTVTSVTFEQHIRSRVYGLLAESQAALVTSTLALIGFSETKPSTSPGKRTIWKPDDAFLLDGLPPGPRSALEERYILRSSDSLSDIQRYLREVGGVLNIDPSFAQITADLRLLREAAIANQSRLSSIESTLRQLLKVSVDVDLRGVAASVRDRIEATEAQIKRLNETYEKSSKGAHREYKKLLGNYALSIATFALGAASLDKAATAGQVKASDKKMESGLGQIGKSFLALRNFKWPEAPNVQDTKKALEDLRDFQNALEAATARARSDLERATDHSLARALSTAADHESLVSKRVRHFSELYKATWAGYALGAAPSDRLMASNFEDLRDYVLASRTTAFDFGALNVKGDCSGNREQLSEAARDLLRDQKWVVHEGCLLIKPAGRQRSFFGTLVVPRAQAPVILPVVVEENLNTGMRSYDSRPFGAIHERP
jgi:hypothetical protein